MERMTWRMVFVVTGLGLTVMGVSPSALGQSYDIIDLDTLGGIRSEASALNNHGEVVGSSFTTAGEMHAFLWLPAPAYGLPAGMNDLGTLSGSGQSYGRDVNDSGQVVGRSDTDQVGESGTIAHAFLWVNGVMTDLGAPGDNANWSRATGVNEAGEIVGGWSTTPLGLFYGSFLWLPAPAYGFPAGMNELTGLATGVASSINASGQVVQTSYNDAGPPFTTAWVWLPSPAYGLPAGLVWLPALDAAYSINDSGQIVGVAETGGADHAHLWESGVLTDLGTLGGDWSYPSGICNAGAVVGWAETDARRAVYRAFLWDGGPMKNLNDRIPPDSGWVLSQGAVDVNESGQIVGHGLIDGETRAYLLTPAVCGNAQIEGLEQCDNGNTEPGDGCDAFCQIEPEIPAVSQWGIVVLALVTLTAGSVIIRRSDPSLGT